jgi:hypothetical protein
MWAIDELTIEDLDGRRIWERFGKRAARSKKRPLRVSRRCLSTALWVALRSAVFARLLGFLFPAEVRGIGEELESALTSEGDSEIGGGVSGDGGWVEDEVEAPSEGLEGIWTDIAMEKRCEKG